MKPYGNIQSQNLKFVLFLARTLACLGLVAFVLGLVFFIVSAFMPLGIFAASIGGALLPLALGVLIISSLLAAITAFEESYRVRTEYLVG